MTSDRSHHDPIQPHTWAQHPGYRDALSTLVGAAATVPVTLLYLFLLALAAARGVAQHFTPHILIGGIGLIGLWLSVLPVVVRLPRLARVGVCIGLIVGLNLSIELCVVGVQDKGGLRLFDFVFWWLPSVVAVWKLTTVARSVVSAR